MTVTSITAARLRSRRRDARVLASRRSIALMLVPMMILIVVGLGALLSASSVLALREFGDSLHFFKRQVLWSAAGGLALAAGIAIPYRSYQRLAVPLMAATIIGLVLVLAVGVAGGGSRRWLALGPLTLQPSEFAKFSVVVFLAAVMVRKKALVNDLAHFAWPVVASIGVAGALIMAQPDLGTTLIITAAGFAVLMASAAPMRYVAGTAALGVFLGVALARVSPYRWARITAFLDPFADRYDTGLQAVQSLLALGSGGWFGLGLGASRARWAFLPNAHTDFIFAIIGEETGLVGALGVLALFGLLTVGGVMVAAQAVDEFGRLLAAGLTAWLVVQALVNLGGVVGLLPITGVPLPFVSFGGNALVAEMAAVGVLINIARTRIRERA